MRDHRAEFSSQMLDLHLWPIAQAAVLLAFLLLIGTTQGYPPLDDREFFRICGPSYHSLVIGQRAVSDTMGPLWRTQCADLVRPLLGRTFRSSAASDSPSPFQIPFQIETLLVMRDGSARASYFYPVDWSRIRRIQGVNVIPVVLEKLEDLKNSLQQLDMHRILYNSMLKEPLAVVLHGLPRLRSLSIATVVDMTDARICAVVSAHGRLLEEVALTVSSPILTVLFECAQRVTKLPRLRMFELNIVEMEGSHKDWQKPLLTEFMLLIRKLERVWSVYGNVLNHKSFKITVHIEPVPLAVALSPRLETDRPVDVFRVECAKFGLLVLEERTISDFQDPLWQHFCLDLLSRMVGRPLDPGFPPFIIEKVIADRSTDPLAFFPVIWSEIRELSGAAADFLLQEVLKTTPSSGLPKLRRITLYRGRVDQNTDCALSFEKRLVQLAPRLESVTFLLSEPSLCHMESVLVFFVERLLDLRSLLFRVHSEKKYAEYLWLILKRLELRPSVQSVSLDVTGAQEYVIHVRIQRNENAPGTPTPSTSDERAPVSAAERKCESIIETRTVSDRIVLSPECVNHLQVLLGKPTLGTSAVYRRNPRPFYIEHVIVEKAETIASFSPLVVWSQVRKISGHFALKLLPSVLAGVEDSLEELQFTATTMSFFLRDLERVLVRLSNLHTIDFGRIIHSDLLAIPVARTIIQHAPSVSTVHASFSGTLADRPYIQAFVQILSYSDSLRRASIGIHSANAAERGAVARGLAEALECMQISFQFEENVEKGNAGLVLLLEFAPQSRVSGHDTLVNNCRARAAIMEEDVDRPPNFLEMNLLLWSREALHVSAATSELLHDLDVYGKVLDSNDQQFEG